ncbi:MAG: hypothetical protein IPO27_12305 [Bacteroidetes bacterium]|nr:hypothetical protein [Bacteroidota bacterium]
MESLSSNWITEKHIDFEYKKYMLLAYLQYVGERFNDTELFPHLSSLIEHYRNVQMIKNNKLQFQKQTPEQLTGFDLSTFKALYEKISFDNEVMNEIELIINFSIPQFEQYMAEGKKIYEIIESKLQIGPVGVLPINTFEGYMFLSNGDTRETRVYSYQVSIFEHHQEKYRGIHTTYVCSYERTLTNSFENIKLDLLRQFKQLPNPATFLVSSKLCIPIDATLLPMAKRMLIRCVSST